jgi:putative peptidoglycan lipid II flippase
VLARPIVELLYERRAFTADNTTAVTALLVVLACAVPGWVVQQVAVRGFYARGEMWRAMILSSAIALAVIPIYVILARVEGVRGLAMASVTAITLNAMITVSWLRARTGAPELLPLLETLGRTLLISIAAGSATLLVFDHAMVGIAAAWARAIVGGLIYGGVALVGIRFVGDAPLRAGMARLSARVPFPGRRSAERGESDT